MITDAAVNDTRKRLRGTSEDAGGELVAYLKQQLQEVKAEAERRIAEAIALGEKREKEANERTKDAIALGEKRTKDAIALGDKRLQSFYNFARGTVQDLKRDIAPIIHQTQYLLSDQKKSITYGCQGRVLMGNATIEFDFVEGNKSRVSIEIDVPTEQLVRAREIKIAKRGTEYKSVVDPSEIITQCIESVQSEWKKRKHTYPVSETAKRRKLCQ